MHRVRHAPSEHLTRLYGPVTVRHPYSYPFRIRPIFGENYDDPFKPEAERAQKAEAREVKLGTEIRFLREADATQRTTALETLEGVRTETGRRAGEEVAELHGRSAVLTEHATRYRVAALTQAPAAQRTTSGEALPETPEDSKPAQ